MTLSGLIAAPHTPFHPDGSLNPDAIDRQADHLVTNGVAGAFVCGTTGEGMSLTSAERRAVAARWVKSAGGRFPVVVHVGHACLGDAQELAAHAAGAGADAVAAVAPFYHTAPGVPELVDYFVRLASASRLPFYVYDIPGVTGVTMPTALVMRELAGAAPTFAGVKFSNPDLVTLQECLAVGGGKYDVLFGIDEALLPAWALGVRGAVGSTYNFAAPLYRRMIAAFDAGEMVEAARLQRQSVELVRLLEKHAGLAAGKALMGIVGVECGPVRPPLRPLTPGQVAALRDGARELL